MNMPAIGKLRHQITIQYISSVSESAYGSRTPTWSAKASNVWALVEPTGGGSFWRGMKVEGDVTHAITLRHMTSVTDAITPAMRVSFDSRTFQIERVINVDEADKWLVMLCTERVT